jgi:hypothetical protein
MNAYSLKGQDSGQSPREIYIYKNLGPTGCPDNDFSRKMWK